MCSGNSDINGCVGNLAGSDIATVVAGLDNAVDLVISGHTHAAYNCSANTVDNGSTPRATGLPNKAGRLVPVTSASAFGRVITEVGGALAALPEESHVQAVKRPETACPAARPETAYPASRPDMACLEGRVPQRFSPCDSNLPPAPRPRAATSHRSVRV